MLTDAECYLFPCMAAIGDDSGHNSMIYFVDEVGPSPSAQSVAFRDLPLRDVGQHHSRAF